MNFNARTHALALSVIGFAGLAAHWFLNHNAQLIAAAQFIANHPVYSLSGFVVPLLAALYNPSK